MTAMPSPERYRSIIAKGSVADLLQIDRCKSNLVKASCQRLCQKMGKSNLASSSTLVICPVLGEFFYPAFMLRLYPNVLSKWIDPVTV